MDHLTISGPTLAAWLSVFSQANRPCDGLLFGSVCTTTTTHAHDVTDALIVQEHEGRIENTYACIGTHTFYKNSGDIQSNKLEQLLQLVNSSAATSHHHQHQLLGWFSYRPGTPCAPSMREAAVTQHLQAWTSSRCSSSKTPIVFGLLTSQPDHNAATISLQYKFYKTRGSSSSSNASSVQASSSSSHKSRHVPEHPLLQPLDLQVLNLGTSHGTAAGISSRSSSSTFVWGSPSLPALAAALQPMGAAANATGVLSKQQREHLLDVSAGLTDGAMAAVNEVYSSLLEELQVAAAQVSAQQSCLDTLRGRTAELQQQLQCAGRAAPVTLATAPSSAACEGLI